MIRKTHLLMLLKNGSGYLMLHLKRRLEWFKWISNSDYVFGNQIRFSLATENVFLQGGIINKFHWWIKWIVLSYSIGVTTATQIGFYVDSGSRSHLGTKLVWNPSMKDW